MWYKNIAGRFFGSVTKHACDRQTNRRTCGPYRVARLKHCTILAQSMHADSKRMNLEQVFWRTFNRGNDLWHVYRWLYTTNERASVAVPAGSTFHMWLIASNHQSKMPSCTSSMDYCHTQAHSAITIQMGATVTLLTILIFRPHYLLPKMSNLTPHCIHQFTSAL